MVNRRPRYRSLLRFRSFGPGHLACPAACRLLAITLALLLMVSAVPVPPAPAQAYGNLSAHPQINREAIDRYEERALQDEWLAMTTLTGLPVAGVAVTEPGLLQIREETVTKTLAEWITHGGMSADEPELPASFRHFFDPLRLSGASYLTDHLDDLLEFGFRLRQRGGEGNREGCGGPRDIERLTWR